MWRGVSCSALVLVRRLSCAASLGSSRLLSVSGGHAKAVAVWVGQLDLSPPRLVVNLRIELHGDRVDVLDPEVDERAGSSIAGVLREMELHAVAIQEHVERKARLNRCLPTTSNPSCRYHFAVSTASVTRKIGIITSTIYRP